MRVQFRVNGCSWFGVRIEGCAAIMLYEFRGFGMSDLRDCRVICVLGMKEIPTASGTKALGLRRSWLASPKSLLISLLDWRVGKVNTRNPKTLNRWPKPEIGARKTGAGLRGFA